MQPSALTLGTSPRPCATAANDPERAANDTFAHIFRLGGGSFSRAPPLWLLATGAAPTRWQLQLSGIAIAVLACGTEWTKEDR